MTSRPSPMVMRSVYLPEDMDLRLRQVAFSLHRPKADLIRAFVAHGLNGLRNDIDRLSPQERDREVSRIFGVTQEISDLEARAYDADIDRLNTSLEAEQPAGRAAAE